MIESRLRFTTRRRADPSGCRLREKSSTKLEAKIPGKGDKLSERYEKWRKPFIIPKEKLDAVFQLAINACRERTRAHLELPPNESFTVEYVTGKPWGGYNLVSGQPTAASSRSTPICRLTSIARSISRRTKVIPATTFTTRSSRKT